jgi:hypothetical protein
MINTRWSPILLPNKAPYLMAANDSIMTGTGILIIRGLFLIVLVPLGGEPRESLEEWRQLYRFRNILYSRYRLPDKVQSAG